MYIAIEVQDQVWIYKYDIRNIKYPPVYINRIKVIGGISFLMFLRDAVFGVFYPTHLIIYQIEENNTILIYPSNTDHIQLMLITYQVRFNIYLLQKTNTAIIVLQHITIHIYP